LPKAHDVWALDLVCGDVHRPGALSRGDGRSSNELRAINHADIDVALADIDGAYLLIGDGSGGGELGGAVEIGVQLGD
jgi:hypothetical protein